MNLVFQSLKVFRIFFVCAFFSLFPILAQAADIQAQLDSNNGQSGFSVQTNSAIEVARVDSSGNLTIHGNEGIGTTTPHALLDVSTAGESPIFLLSTAANSVYIGNNLEVDGTAYLQDATIGSLTISEGIATTGGSTFDHLEVTGSSFLGTLLGNVGIGTTAADASLEILKNGINPLLMLSSKANGGGNYLIVNSSGNVGIGTTTPNGALSVMSGNVGIGTWNTQALLDVSTGGASPVFLGAMAPESEYIQNDLEVDGTAYLVDATIGTLTISEGLSLTGSSTFSNIEVTGESVFNTLSGNVGIGTTMTGASANTKLAVLGGNVGIGTTSPVNIVQIGTNPAGYSANDLVVSRSGGESLAFYTGNPAYSGIQASGPLVLQQNAGNVGIGTTTPNGALSVMSGNVGVGTWNPQALLDVSTGGASPLFLGAMAPESEYIQNDLEVDGMTYLEDATIGSLTVSAGISLSGSATFSNIEVQGEAVFNTISGNVGIGTTMTGASTGTGLAVMNGNVGIGTTMPGGALSVMNGNVGIGTWNPQALLDVSTGGASPLFLGGMAPESEYIQNDLEVDGTTYLEDAMIGTLTVSAAISLSGSATFSTIEVTGESVFNTISGNVGIGTTMTGALANTKLAVLGGSVGIGTTSPGSDLSVLGGAAIGAYAVNTAPTGGMIVSGNLGIATNSPGSTVQVNGNAVVGYSASTAGPNNGLAVSGNVGIGTITPNGALSVMSGNVGIGTWNPQALLDVSTGGASPVFLGAMAPESEYIQNDLEVDGTTYLVDATIGMLTISEGLTLAGGSTFDHIEVTGESVFNTISGNVGIGTTMTGASTGTGLAVMNGNVGIGTTMPGGALSVMNGNVGIGTWNPQALLDVSTGGLSPSFLGAMAPASEYIQNDLEVDGTTYLEDAMIGTLTVSAAISLSGSATFSTIEVQGESVFNTLSGNVGIGTTMTGASTGTGLAVMNGNVGVGTTSPGSALSVLGGAAIGAYAVNTAPTGGMIVSGNLGIATNSPGSTVQVNGNEVVGYSASTAGPNNGLAVSGNVGIGTITPNGALSVMSGNVGIGTWNPQALLDVSTGGASPAFLGAMAPESEYIQNDLEVDGTTYLVDATIGMLTISEGLTLAGGSTFDHIEVTGESVFNTISGNVGIGTTMTGASTGTGLAVMNGNVGVGTTSPGSALSVLGGAAIGAYAVNPAPTGGMIVSGNLGIATNSPGSTVQVNGNEVVGYSASTAGPNNGLAVSGNVGIGTITPNGALSVMSGNVGIGTWNPQALLDVSTGGASPVFLGAMAPESEYIQNDLEVDGTTYLVDATIGMLTISEGLTLAGGSTFDHIEVTGESVFNTISGNVGIGTTMTGASTGTGLAVMNGNVGVGTTSPGSALSVLGGAAIGAYAVNPAPTGGMIVSGNLGIATNSPGSTVQVNGNAVVGYSASTAGPNNGLAVSGNVGMGTLLPSSGLSVGSNGVSIGSNYTNGISAPSNGLIVQGNVGIGTITPNGALSVMSGNVGIGTWNPQALLDVSTGGASPVFLGAMAPESEYIQNDLEVDGTTYLVDATIGMLTISEGLTLAGGSTFDNIEVTGESVFNTLSGNVGIGTTMTGASAGTKLAVLGGNVGIGTTSAQGILAIPYGVGNVGIGTIAPSSELQVNPISNSPFTVSSTGNVGIGTNANQVALSVMNGNVGIGTWTASSALQVVGNVGIGTSVPSSGLSVGPNGVSIGENYTNGTSAPTNGLIVQGNVGIGTANPLNSLQVQGTTGAAAGIYLNSAVPSNISYTLYNNGGTLTWNGLTIDAGTSISGTQNYISYFTGSTSIADSIIYESGNNIGIGTITPNGGLSVMTGNVGIGTWNTQALLDVSTGGASPVFLGAMAPESAYIQNDLEVDGRAYLVDATIGTLTTSIGITATGGSTFDHIEVTGESVFNTLSGNVGIGTTMTGASAGTKLAVLGGNVGIGTTSSQGILAIPYGVGNVGIGTISPSSEFQINPISNSPFTVSSTGNVGLGTNANQVALSVMNGNVGIGTWTAGNNLSVIGGVGIGSATYASTTAPANGLIVQGNVGIGTTNPQGILAIPYGVGNVGIGTIAPASLLQVNPISNSPFTVSSTGNVGLGTSANQVALSVMNGNVGIGTWTAGNNLSVIGGVGIGSASYASTAAPSNGLIVQGNVGIGTTSPQGILAIPYGVGNVGIGTIAPSSEFQINPISNSPFTVSSTGNVGIGTNANQAALSVMNGNVGIGTWVPVGALDIKTVNNVFVESSNVGIGTLLPSSGLSVGSNGESIGVKYTNGTSAPANGLAVQGNVGIGTTIPGGALSVMSGNVGIGTWNPQALLAVSTVTGGPSFLLSAASNSVYIQNDLEVDGTAYLVDATIGTLTTSIGITATGGSTFDHIEVTGESVFNTLSGNVGIGTTMTGALANTKLAVLGGNVGIGTTSAQGILAIPYGVGNVGVGTISPSSEFQINPISNSPFTVSSTGNVGLGTNANQVALSVMNGNVGIGTWTAGNNLSVIGGVGIGSATYASTAAPANGLIVQGNVGIATTTPQGILAIPYGVGNVGIGTISPSSLLQVNAISNSPFTVSSTGNVGLGTNVNQTALSVMNGNVGIGTWTASSALQVVGNVGIGTSVPSSGLSVGSNGESIGVKYTNGTSAPTNGLAVQGNVGIGTTIPGGALSVMSGNVGIGTWNPQALLSVSTVTGGPSFLLSAASNSVYIQNDLEVDGTAYLVDATIGTLTTSLGITSVGGSTFDHIEVTGESVFNTLSGNVGIGTTMTGALANTKLAVLGGNVGIGTTSAQGILAIPYGVGNVGIGTIAPSSEFQVNPISNSPFTVSSTGNVGVGTNANQAALSVMNGNVGIGTWTANSALQVVGNVGIGTSVPSSGLSVGSNGVSIGANYTNGTSAPTNGLIVQGNVGIGTTSPLNSLQVQGTGGAAAGIYLNSAVPLNGTYTLYNNGGTLTWNGFPIDAGISISGTTNYLSYFTGSTSLADSIIYESGNNIGIGTTTPNGGLSVMTGNVGIGTWNTQALLDVSTGGASPAFLGAMAPESAYIQNDLEVDGRAYLVDATIGTLTTSIGITATGGSTFDHIEVTGESVFNTLSGNVGIGTTMTGASAGTKLAVLGGNVGIGTTSSQGILVIPYGVGNVGIGTIAPSALLQVNPISNSPFTVSSTGNVGLGTNANQAALSVMNGNVGIGTWTAGNNLSVIGGVGIGSATYASTTAPANGLIVQGNVGIGTTSPQGILAIPYGVGNVGIGTIAPASLLQVNPISNSPFTVSSMGNVGLGTNADQTALSVMNGNVGIGTWTASSALQVVGNVGIGTSLPSSGLSVGTNGVSIGANYTNGTSAPSNGLIVQGNVGIGTAVPLNSLQVQGTTGAAAGIYLNSAVPLNESYTLYNNGGTLTWNGLTINAGTSISGTTNYLSYFTNSTSLGDSIIYESGNNIGIGTITPNGGLSVMTGNVGIGTWNTQALLDVSTGGESPAFLGAMAPESAYIQNDLEVDGTAYLVDATIGTLTTSIGITATGGSTFDHIEVTGEAVFNTLSGNVGIGTTMTGASASTKLAVLGGNVGIGTWIPSSLLDVEGGNIGIGTAFSIMAGSTGNTILTLRTDTSSIYAGYQAGTLVAAGSLNNTAYGFGALYSNTTGYNNIANGNRALYSNTTGAHNNANGLYALSNNTTGGGNTANGTSVLYNNTTGNNNTASGNTALYSNITGANNIALGYGAGYNYLGSNGFFVNNVAEFNVANDEEYSLLYGTFSGVAGSLTGQQLTINGNVGIGTITPNGALSVMSGNVGIGTWNPQALLDVSTGGESPAFLGGMASESEYVQNDLEVDGTAYLVDATVGTLTTSLGITSVGGSTFDHIEVTGEAVFNTLSGNVGIGTTMTGASDNTKLAVLGGNVGIGTTTAQGAFVVTNGNVGIGTWAPSGALVVMNGNVGIGGVNPQATLQLEGAAPNMIIKNDATPITWTWATNVNSGAYLTLSTGSGSIMQYSATGVSIGPAVSLLNAPAPTSLLLSASGGNAPLIILTGPTNAEAMRVTSLGNLGIGTTVPGSNLSVLGSESLGSYATTTAPAGGLLVSGNVGIGTITPGGGLAVMNGNVGIGTWNPQALLDVSTGGESPAFLGAMAPESEYIQNDLEVDGTAYLVDATIGTLTTSLGITSVGGSTFDHIEVTGEAVLNTLSGNVGIGTTMTGASANTKLAVLGGNVGIGTTTPQGGLVVTNGNVGIGTWAPVNSLDVVSGNIGIGTAFSIMAGSTGNTILTLRTDTTSIYAGYQAGASTTAGNLFNTVYGYVALSSNATGSYNTANGGGTLQSNITGANNTANGYQALFYNTTGANNTANGYQSLYHATGSNNIALGYGAGYNYLGSNGFFVNNVEESSVANDEAYSLLYGTLSGTAGSLAGQQLTINGNVGIGTITPGGALSVMSGNVGIGTWNPQALLDVSTGGGSPSFLGAMAPESEYIQNDLEVDGTAYLVDATIGTLTTSLGITSVGGSTFDHIEVTGEAVFNTLSGNVGVGTTMTGASASTKFQVNPISNSPFTVSSTGNVGLGTNADQAALSVMNGNVGIGTWTAGNNLSVIGGVGIGSATYASTAAPANGLIVQGNVGIGTTNPQGILAIPYGVGNVGIGTIAPASLLQVNPISNSPFTVSSTGNVGIGTSANQVALSVMNGNVGIGTWTAGNNLSVIGGVGIGSASYASTTAPDNGLIVQGNVGIGTSVPSSGLSVGTNGESIGVNYTNGTSAPSNGLVVQGNVGIGTTIPGGALSVMTGNVGIGTWNPQALLSVSTLAGGPSFLLSAASNSVYIQNDLEVDGTAYLVDATIGTLTTSLGITSVGGSTFDHIEVTGESVFNTLSGNVGIGTTMTGASTGTGLAVMNGNVGIGTTTPAGALTVMNGNVGIGTWVPGGALVVQGGNVGIGTSIPAALLHVSGNTILGQTQSSSDSISVNYLGLPAAGSLAGGYAAHGGAGVGIIAVSGPGGLAFGDAFGAAGSNGSIISSGYGSIAMGQGEQGGTLSAGGTLAAGGNIAMGQAAGVGASLSAVNGTLGGGNIAMGASNGGTFTSSGYGSIAMGYATTTLQATGTGSVAIGENVQATAANALAFGNNVINNNASTFMVGFNTNPTLTVTSANVGIGTITPGNLLSINGGVGIGTANSSYVNLEVAPSGGMIVQGNVGIGTFLPSSGLSVGTNGESIGANYTNGISAPNNGLIVQANVGIGTTFVGGAGEGALTVMNGNVGIGTWVPGYSVDVQGGGVNTSYGFCIKGVCETTWGSGTLPFATNGETLYNNNGTWNSTFNLYNDGTNVGIGTTTPGGALTVMSGNVGIGTWNPQALLAVSTVSGTPSFLLSAASNSVYIQNDLEVDGTAYLVDATVGTLTTSIGITATGGSTFDHIEVTGESVFNTLSGNVGIGTTMTGASVGTKLAVLGGNVGIGTTSPAGALTVMNGNVGIGTWVPGGSLVVMGGNVGIGTNLPDASLNLNGSLALESSGVSVTISGITAVNRTVMRVQGSGGSYPVLITANPQIAAGVDGQTLVLIGSSNSNTIKLVNGNGLTLSSGIPFTLGLGNTIVLMYDSSNNDGWTEISRAAAN